MNFFSLLLILFDLLCHIKDLLHSRGLRTREIIFLKALVATLSDVCSAHTVGKFLLELAL